MSESEDKRSRTKNNGTIVPSVETPQHYENIRELFFSDPQFAEWIVCIVKSDRQLMEHIAEIVVDSYAPGELKRAVLDEFKRDIGEEVVQGAWWFIKKAVGVLFIAALGALAFMLGFKRG